MAFCGGPWGGGIKVISFKGRWIDRNKIVHVYRNLNSGGDPKLRWSIRQGSVVVGHSDRLLLYRAEMVIQPAGVAKCHREGRKNVHAYIKGHFCDELTYIDTDGRVKVTILPDSPKIPANCEWVMYDSRDGKFYRQDIHRKSTAIPVDFAFGPDRCRDWALFTPFGVLTRKDN